MHDHARQPEEEDSSLIREAQEGNERAQKELYERCAPKLEAYLRQRMGQALRRYATVSDLCAETFGRAFRALHVLRDDPTLDDFQGVLFRNAHWTLTDVGRRARRFRGESAGDQREPPAEERRRLDSGTVTREDERDWIRLQVNRLDPRHADVVRLRLDGLSFEEIGRTLEIEAETARKRYLRASTKLRKLLGSDIEQ